MMETASHTSTVAASLRALMDGLIDYAGLFPPAAVDMRTAVSNYARYQQGGFCWALGRFICPAGRLREFSTELMKVEAASGWQVSAIISADTAGDLELVRSFNNNQSQATVEVIEAKAGSIEEVKRTSELLPNGIVAYFEVPPDVSSELLGFIASIGACAKIRTGGLVETVFPAAEQVARFIVRCANAKVAFKATAGLHHPLRCVKPLTYEPNAPTGKMHGFLNVFLAACVYGALTAPPDEEHREQLRAAMVAILLNETPANFTFQDENVILRGMLQESLSGIERNSNYELSISTEVIQHARANFAIAFGSCSFEEPMDDLRNLHLL